ncbi:retrovirus-related Pol polyprotein from transposon 297 [Trichonephila clavipes]|nr:retrovirus-related Pol polyprotein from transposon 297 [Trichonephila clavipes]
MEEIVEKKVSPAPICNGDGFVERLPDSAHAESSERYAAFVTPFGTYIPSKMMFGLVCAPYYFCKLMAQVLEGLEQFALPYIDDIAIFFQGWKDHVKHIDIVLGRLRKAGLKVKPLNVSLLKRKFYF